MTPTTLCADEYTSDIEIYLIFVHIYKVCFNYTKFPKGVYSQQTETNGSIISEFKLKIKHI